MGAGVSSAMESYNSLNSLPVASSRRYLIDILRGRLGFLGMLVTDYAEIANLEHHHRVSAGEEDSVFMAMEDTSIDMSMVPLDASFAETLLRLVREGQVSHNRIERSVRRVVALKVCCATCQVLGRQEGRKELRYNTTVAGCCRLCFFRRDESSAAVRTDYLAACSGAVAGRVAVTH